jgi:regulator of sirC expression with transglutaminase-like and TPR domain
VMPHDWSERRDLALVLKQLGRSAKACVELALYLQHQPDAEDAAALRRELLDWQRAH